MPTACSPWHTGKKVGAYWTAVRYTRFMGTWRMQSGGVSRAVLSMLALAMRHAGQLVRNKLARPQLERWRRVTTPLDNRVLHPPGPPKRQVPRMPISRGKQAHRRVPNHPCTGAGGEWEAPDITPLDDAKEGGRAYYE